MNMFDMMGMMGKVKDMQNKLQQAKEALVHLQVTSESGGGMVKATLNGHKKLVKLEIDPELIKPEEKEMLQDLCVAAINKALSDIDEKSKEELKKATEGILPNIPGMDLGSMFGGL